ncbi:MAG TPA: DUF302 domain-containing protein [Candidatus Acidoferrales bacterium]|nr:DUF302 domain-containing protein [Candidatus Acidoferrales bacterium]
MRRLTVTSSKPFQDVVTAFEAAVGHPNMAEFSTQLNAAKTYAEMESIVQAALSKAGFMQFTRFDLGAVIRKESGKDKPKSIRYLVGNPLIMKEMVKHVPDAGSYAPVTVLIDERADAVHLSYDLMSAFLSRYGNKDALEVARDLDAKVENLLKQAAA